MHSRQRPSAPHPPSQWYDPASAPPLNEMSIDDDSLPCNRGIVL